MTTLKTIKFAKLLAATGFAIAGFTPCRSALAQTPVETSHVEAQPQIKISSEADLAKLVAQLEQPSTRLSALSRLVDFARVKLYKVGSISIFVGDEQTDALVNKAVEVVLKQTDFKTVSQALNSTDPTLQSWGVRFWQGGTFKSRDTQPNVWVSLFPKIKDLAVNGNANVRSVAVEVLQSHGEAKSFLAKRLVVETDAFIVSRLLDHLDKDERSNQLTPYLLRFLNHEDNEVRRRTLLFIALNYYSAPVRKMTFDKPVADKVLEMTKSADVEERKAALFALEGMQKKAT